jgi:hypothetical protein
MQSKAHGLATSVQGTLTASRATAADCSAESGTSGEDSSAVSSDDQCKLVTWRIGEGCNIEALLLRLARRLQQKKHGRFQRSHWADAKLYNKAYRVAFKKLAEGGV